jgi:hypothetical protein
MESSHALHSGPATPSYTSTRFNPLHARTNIPRSTLPCQPSDTFNGQVLQAHQVFKPQQVPSWQEQQQQYMGTFQQPRINQQALQPQQRSLATFQSPQINQQASQSQQQQTPQGLQTNQPLHNPGPTPSSISPSPTDLALVKYLKDGECAPWLIEDTKERRRIRVNLRSRGTNERRNKTDPTLPIDPPMGLDRCRPCTMSSKECGGAVPVCSECSGLTDITCTYSQPVSKFRGSPSTATCHACVHMRSSCDGAYPKCHQCPTDADYVYPRPKPTGAHEECRNCKEGGLLQCDKGFPACQNCKTIGKSCLYFFKSLPLRALLRPSITALLYRRELRDPNGLLAPRSYSYKNLILDRDDLAAAKRLYACQ